MKNRMWTSVQKYYNQMKLAQKIRGIFLTLTVAYLALIVVGIFGVVSNSVTQHLQVHSRTMVEGVGENLNASFRSVSNMSLLIMNDDGILSYLRSGEVEKSIPAVSNMKRISAAFPNIYSIFLFREENNYFISSGRNVTMVNQEVLIDSGWQEELDRRRGGFAVRLQGGGIFYMSTGTDIVSFMRRIYDRDTQLPLGYLVVNMPVRIFQDSLEQLTIPTERFRAVDLDDRVLGDATMEEGFKVLLEGDESYIQWVERRIGGMHVFTTMLVAENSLRIGMVEEISYFSLLMGQINAIWILFIVITVIGLFVLGLFISRTITQPIELLTRSMEEVKQGHLKRVSMQLPNDEIGMLKDTYNNMLVEANRLIDYMVEQEKRVKNIELEILHEQIKPHFLYNTLDTICFMVFENSPKEVYGAIETLGNFYRKSLSKGKTTIPLADEISIVKDYLALQRLRYGGIFEDIYEIEADISGVTVPKMILQPLVENCIYHGIRPKGELGMIWIRVKEVGYYLEISVRDNGVGMTQDEIREFLQREDSSSFGYKGTFERLKYHYQSDTVCTVHSKKGEYFQVTITIPYKLEKKAFSFAE